MKFIDPDENIYNTMSVTWVERVIRFRLKEIGVDDSAADYALQDMGIKDDIDWFVEQEGLLETIGEVYSAYGILATEQDLTVEQAAIAVINIHSKYANLSLSIDGAIALYHRALERFKEIQIARLRFRKIIESKLGQSNQTIN